MQHPLNHVELTKVLIDRRPHNRPFMEAAIASGYLTDNTYSGARAAFFDSALKRMRLLNWLEKLHPDHADFIATHNIRATYQAELDAEMAKIDSAGHFQREY